MKKDQIQVFSRETRLGKLSAVVSDQTFFWRGLASPAIDGFNLPLSCVFLAKDL